MPKFIVGARLHDYGKGTPDELFAKVSADGFAAVQLAYKKCVPTVKSYADVTDALVADTIAAEKAHSIQVAVLGTYVELAINDESRLQNAADFKSQLARLPRRWGPGALARRRPPCPSSPPVRPARKPRNCFAAAWLRFCPQRRSWASRWALSL